jgi:hypothetical protein
MGCGSRSLAEAEPPQPIWYVQDSVCGTTRKFARSAVDYCWIRKPYLARHSGLAKSFRNVGPAVLLLQLVGAAANGRNIPTARIAAITRFMDSLQFAFEPFEFLVH